jgi:hypothetical protein
MLRSYITAMTCAVRRIAILLLSGRVRRKEGRNLSRPKRNLYLCCPLLVAKSVEIRSGASLAEIPPAHTVQHAWLLLCDRGFLTLYSSPFATRKVSCTVSGRSEQSLNQNLLWLSIGDNSDKCLYRLIPKAKAIADGILCFTQ